MSDLATLPAPEKHHPELCRARDHHAILRHGFWPEAVRLTRYAAHVVAIQTGLLVFRAGLAKTNQVDERTTGRRAEASTSAMWLLQTHPLSSL